MILLRQQNKQNVHPLSPLCLRIWLDYWVVCALYISHYADIFHLPLPFATHTIHNPSGSRGRHELIDIPRGMTHINVGDAFERLLSSSNDGKNVVEEWDPGFVGWLTSRYSNYYSISALFSVKSAIGSFAFIKTIQQHSTLILFSFYCWLWPVKMSGQAYPFSASSCYCNQSPFTDLKKSVKFENVVCAEKWRPISQMPFALLLEAALPVQKCFFRFVFYYLQLWN